MAAMWGAYGSHAGVPAGATVLNGNSAFAWVAEPGRHTITFVVDVDNYIDETNESNNRWTIVVRMPQGRGTGLRKKQPFSTPPPLILAS